MATQNLQAWFSQLQFSELDITVILVNLMTLAGSGLLTTWFSNNRSEKTIKRRVTALRIINLVVLAIYSVAAVLGFPLGQKFAQQVICLILAFGVNHLVQSWILSRFGTDREIDGQIITVSSYTSDMIGLLARILVIALTLIALIDIWDLDNWLQATSIIGAFVLILYACKDYVLADIISSLIMNYNRTIEPGNVIRIKELGILGVVQHVTLSQTTIRDLLQHHIISIANSRVRNAVIENLSHTKGNISEYIDFKVGYQYKPEQVENALTFAWQQVLEQGDLLENNISIRIIENQDHAVLWRMVYRIKNPYKILEIREKLNRSALVHCHHQGIHLNTPLTHEMTSADHKTQLHPFTNENAQKVAITELPD